VSTETESTSETASESVFEIVSKTATEIESESSSEIASESLLEIVSKTASDSAGTESAGTESVRWYGNAQTDNESAKIS